MASVPSFIAPAQVVSEAEAAERVGVTVYWLATQARLKLVPFAKMGRYRRYTDEHIGQIIADRTVNPGQTLGRSARSRKGRVA